MSEGGATGEKGVSQRGLSQRVVYGRVGKRLRSEAISTGTSLKLVVANRDHVPGGARAQSKVKETAD
jgi:hypothetical protein